MTEVRTDVAAVLQFMGYVPEVDFAAVGSKGKTFLQWLAQSPVPDAAAIDAAALEMATAQQAEAVKVAESTTARDDAKRALTALDTIIAGAPTATTAQMRAWVEQLARIAKQHILATVGR